MPLDANHPRSSAHAPTPYLADLARGLVDEVQRLAPPSKDRHALLGELEAFEHECRQRDESQLEPPSWRARWDRYGVLVRAKAGLLNANAQIARCYDDMDGLWEDADAQVAGRSPKTFWDTYEHGRRRQLEARLARAYGTPGALLLNSGMSAIAVALGSRELRTGARLLTGERSYFETSDYLERFIRARGIELVRVAVDRPNELTAALREVRPAVALLETVTNVPSVPAVRGLDRATIAASSTVFVLDNSVQGHLTRWSSILADAWDRALVVESGTKYLTQECMAGVIYGGSDALAAARHYARATGQQLQEKAFNFLCEAEIDRVADKLSRHSANARIFASVLRGSGMFAFVHALDASTPAGEEHHTLFEAGVGALVFVSSGTRSRDGAPIEQRHRRLLQRWRDRVRAAGLSFDIRAGFGWTVTSARVYETSQLNQPDAPCYLRVSVGIEPPAVARSLAEHMAAAARELEEPGVAR